MLGNLARHFLFGDFSPYCFIRGKLSNLNFITMNKKKLRTSEQSIDLNDSAYVWTTYDLGVSTALLCAGFELLSLGRTNPRKVLFIFHKARNIDETANAYFADRLKLNARSFSDQLKALKNRLYSE
jgi:hypothetical protein